MLEAVEEYLRLLHPFPSNLCHTDTFSESFIFCFFKVTHMYTFSTSSAQLPIFPLLTSWRRCSCSFFPSSIANVWITISHGYYFYVMIIFKVFAVMIAHSLVSGKTRSVSVRLRAKWALVLLYYGFSSAVMLYKITMPAKDFFTLGA